MTQVYRTKYQYEQKGEIGIVLSTEWKEPMCHDNADKAAAERSLIWYLGWFADPVFFGDYPEEMKLRGEWLMQIVVVIVLRLLLLLLLPPKHHYFY